MVFLSTFSQVYLLDDIMCPIKSVFLNIKQHLALCHRFIFAQVSPITAMLTHKYQVLYLLSVQHKIVAQSKES